MNLKLKSLGFRIRLLGGGHCSAINLTGLERRLGSALVASALSWLMPSRWVTLVIDAHRCGMLPVSSASARQNLRWERGTAMTCYPSACSRCLPSTPTTRARCMTRSTTKPSPGRPVGLATGASTPASTGRQAWSISTAASSTAGSRWACRSESRGSAKPCRQGDVHLKHPPSLEVARRVWCHAMTTPRKQANNGHLH